MVKATIKNGTTHKWVDKKEQINKGRVLSIVSRFIPLGRGGLMAAAFPLLWEAWASSSSSFHYLLSLSCSLRSLASSPCTDKGLRRVGNSVPLASSLGSTQAYKLNSSLAHMTMFMPPASNLGSTQGYKLNSSLTHMTICMVRQRIHICDEWILIFECVTSYLMLFLWIKACHKMTKHSTELL